MKKDKVFEVLNSVEAISWVKPLFLGGSARSVFNVLASKTETNYQSVHSWVVQRNYRPRAETFLEIQEWNNDILKMLNQSEKSLYKKALGDITENRKAEMEASP